MLDELRCPEEVGRWLDRECEAGGLEGRSDILCVSIVGGRMLRI